MLDLVTYLRRIMNQGAAETFDPATDSLEAIANALGIGPSVGLWMFGICDPAMVASTTTLVTNNLTGLPTDVFNDQFWVQVILNRNAPGTAPEGEFRRITDFDSATQTFTTNAFSANVEANDLLCIVHESMLAYEILGRGTLTTSSATVPADNTRAGLYAWENNDYFKGCILMPVAGNCRFQPRPIRSYVAATGVFTLDEPFSQVPGTVEYVIIGAAYPVQRLMDIQSALYSMDFWSLPQEEVEVTNVVGDKALPNVIVADLPASADVVRVIAMFKFRMVENTNAAINKLDGVQEIQVRDALPGAWTDAINFVDDLFTLAGGPDTREGGDVIIGAIDVAATVVGNGTYNFQWDDALADANGLRFNDIQVGLRIWYSI